MSISRAITTSQPSVISNLLDHIFSYYHTINWYWWLYYMLYSWPKLETKEWALSSKIMFIFPSSLLKSDVLVVVWCLIKPYSVQISYKKKKQKIRGKKGKRIWIKRITRLKFIFEKEGKTIGLRRRGPVTLVGYRWGWSALFAHKRGLANPCMYQTAVAPLSPQTIYRPLIKRASSPATTFVEA